MKIVVTDDLAACHALRRTVFIEEQNVPEELEIDDLDDIAIHLLAFVKDRPVGTARLFIKGSTGKIGRVCVLPEVRGAGLGAALIVEACRHLKDRGCATAQLGAQTQALPFYEKLGFAAFGPIYDDAGIPHRDMMRRL